MGLLYLNGQVNADPPSFSCEIHGPLFYVGYPTTNDHFDFFSITLVATVTNLTAHTLTQGSIFLTLNHNLLVEAAARDNISTVRLSLENPSIPDWNTPTIYQIITTQWPTHHSLQLTLLIRGPTDESDFDQLHVFAQGTLDGFS